MRKHLLLGSLLACLLFTGCATATNTDVAEVHSQSQEATSELTTDTYGKDLKEGVDINVKVQRNGGMYRVIISADFFGVNEKEEDIKNEVKSWGGENIIIDPETKAVIVDMSVEKYDEYVNNLKLKLEKCMEDIKTDNKKYPSISDVKANDELNEFDIYCKKGIRMEKTISAIELYLDSATYQVFKGVPQKDATVDINYIDEETGDIIETMNTSQLVSK